MLPLGRYLVMKSTERQPLQTKNPAVAGLLLETGPGLENTVAVSEGGHTKQHRYRQHGVNA